MRRGWFTTVMVGVIAALLVVVLVAGVSQRDPASVATAEPTGSDAPEPDAESEPVVDTPVVETPVAEPPVVETPAVETPLVETPIAEDDPETPEPDDSTDDTPVPDQLNSLSVVTSFGGITEAGGEVRFEITVTNQGTAALAVDEGDIELIGPDGPLDVVDGPDRGFEPAELGPGESASGSIVFDVPPGSEGLTLRVAPPGGQPVEIRL